MFICLQMNSLYRNDCLRRYITCNHVFSNNKVSTTSRALLWMHLPVLALVLAEILQFHISCKCYLWTSLSLYTAVSKTSRSSFHLHFNNPSEQSFWIKFFAIIVSLIFCGKLFKFSQYLTFLTRYFINIFLSFTVTSFLGTSHAEYPLTRGRSPVFTRSHPL